MPTRLSARPIVPVAAGLVVVGFVFLLASGVGLGQSTRLVAVVGVQASAGSVVWSWIRRGPMSVSEVLGVGLALGTAMSMLVGLVVVSLGLGGWGWAAPPLAVLATWLVLRIRLGRHPTLAAASIDVASGFALAVTGVVGIGSLVPNLMSYPLAWTGVWSRYHPDMLFFESLATSLARLGPFDSIYTPDAVVRYHWLVYAWSGQITAATDAEPFAVLTRVLPFVAVVGSSLIGIAWARRLSRIVWVPSLAVVLLVLGGYVGATYGAVFNFDSPSQSMTTLWLMAFSLVVVLLLTTPSRQMVMKAHPAVAAVGLLAFSLAGGKISAGAIALAAVVWVSVSGVVKRTPWRNRALYAAVVSSVAFVLGYVLVVSGSADPGGLRLGSLLNRASSIQGLNPIPGSLGVALGTAILALAIAARWAGLAWLLTDREHRWEPSVVFGVGLTLGAVGTVVLVSGGMNDTWFALAASAPLAVISAAGAGEASRALGRSVRPLGWALTTAAVLYVLVALLWSSGASGGNTWVGTARWLAPLAGLVGALMAGWVIGRHYGTVSARRNWLAGTVIVLVLLSAPGRALGFGTGQVGVQPGLGEDEFTPVVSFTQARDITPIIAWSDQHAAAATFLREAADDGDVIVTNVTFSPFVTALTGLQTFASGILYQAPYGRPSGLPVLLEREAESWGFVDKPSVASVAPLCRLGVRWAWVDPTRTAVRDWEPFGVVAFENDAVIVLSLAGGCR